LSLSIPGSQAPVITSISTADFTRGVDGSFTVTTSATPVAKLTKKGTLETGLFFKTQGNGTATISATGKETGTVTVTVTAGNGIAPAATQTVTVVVGTHPKFTSATTATFTPKVANSFTITTSGYPSPSIKESGTLPKGVTFATDGDGTATISGKPGTMKARTYKLTLTATNGFGKAVVQRITLEVS
jgi:hypothetical protein